MQVHPLLDVLARLVTLPPRSRKLIGRLLTEVDGDDDAPAPCRAEAPVEASPPAAAEAPSIITQVDSGRQRASRRPRAPAEAQPATKASAAPEPGDWLRLRGAIRAAIRDRGLTRREAAIAGNFNIGTFARWLSRTARPPGRAAQEQLRAWVDKGMPAQHPPASDAEQNLNTPPAETASTTADTLLPKTILAEALPPAPSNGDASNGVARSVSEPRLSRRGEVLPAYKLSQDQRDRLAFTLEHDPTSVRTVASRALAEKAIAGQRLAPDIVARLAELIDPPPGNGTAV